MTALLALLAIAGVALLRLGWEAREPARVRLTLAGWAAIAFALLALALRDGAWGIAVGAMAAMLCAFVPLARAAAESPAKTRPEREAAPTVALHAENWRGVARRVGVFLLAVPVAGAVALLASLAFQGSARAAGWSEANSTPLGLLGWPVLWGIVTTWVMMHDRPAAMLRPLAITGIPAAALFWLVA